MSTLVINNEIIPYVPNSVEITDDVIKFSMPHIFSLYFYDETEDEDGNLLDTPIRMPGYIKRWKDARSHSVVSIDDNVYMAGFKDPDTPILPNDDVKMEFIIITKLL